MDLCIGFNISSIDLNNRGSIESLLCGLITFQVPLLDSNCWGRRTKDLLNELIVYLVKYISLHKQDTLADEMGLAHRRSTSYARCIMHAEYARRFLGMLPAASLLLNTRVCLHWWI